MSAADREKLTGDLKVHFESEESVVKVTSLHVQFFERKEKGAPDPPVLHVAGTPTITERLFNLSFSVSPQAFFQVTIVRYMRKQRFFQLRSYLTRLP
jgi:hypothetical protein